MSGKNLISTVGSLATTAMVVRGFAYQFLPRELPDSVFHSIGNFFRRFSNQLTMVIDEFDGYKHNQIYEVAEAYLTPKINPNTCRLKISRPEKEKHLNIRMDRGQEIVDYFNGQCFKWVWICRKVEANPDLYNPGVCDEVKSFELTFHKKNKDMVIDSYLPHIAKVAEMKKLEKKTIKIFKVEYNNVWKHVTLDHPATFDTLAMDPDQKDLILKDLDRFVRRRDYYRKVGKAWKRGYLLYGPPGTGKSSLIAAMANHLKYDIYDLELTELRRNTDMLMQLLSTSNKSILVVEDIDSTIDFQGKLAKRETSNSMPGFRHRHQPQQGSDQVTLSGLLNLVDGLWSSCGDERIIVFTTNHIEKLDPALLRPGRMDMHINMSYCTPCGFKLLASNYLEINDHPMFEEIEDLLQNAKATPAEVAEQLLKDDDIDGSLRGLIEFLHEKMKSNDEAQDEKAEATTESAQVVDARDENEEWQL